MNTETITEPFLLVSDVHGHISALEFALKFSESQGIHHLVSLGDMINYQPYGNEVLARIKEYTGLIAAIQGNHERTLVVSRTNPNYTYSSFSQTLYDPPLARWALELPMKQTLQIGDHTVLLCHEHPYSSSILLYPWNEHRLIEALARIKEDRLFFGHTHVQTVFQKEKKLAFNPGSLGVPYKDSTTLTFAWVFPKEEKIQLYAFAYFSAHEKSLPRVHPKQINEITF